MRQLLHEQYVQYENSKTNMQLVNEKYHDLKQLLQGFHGQVSPSQIQKLEQQLDGMVTRNGKEESKQNQDKQQFALIPYVLSYTQDGGLLTSITISAPE